MKTPISYYGGKQSMAKKIINLIPSHKVYVEPFFGGGAIFWAKTKSEVEIINDTNGMVINFYEQLKLNFLKLQKMVAATLYSRGVYKRAMVVYDNPYLFEPLIKAWAFWVVTNQGFSNKIGSWRSSHPRNKESLLIENKKNNFTKGLQKRMDMVQIECIDAVELIGRMDTTDTFFYVDPPYVGANQGHYGGYTQEHFNVLLNKLSSIKGKFMLSHYPNEQINKLADKNGWVVECYDMALTASNSKDKRKCEILVRNY